MPIPSPEELFSKDQAAGAAGGTPGGGLPSPDQLFQPEAGAAHDTLWSNLGRAGSRILDAVGQGAEDGWGSEPLGLDAATEASLRQHGVFNDYQNGHTSLMKSFNEAIIRPAASLADYVVNRGAGIPAAAGAVGGGLEQTEREAAGEHPSALRSALVAPLGIAGELSEGVAAGAFMNDIAAHTPEASAAGDAARARSLGVVGEGEAGFYDAAPPTPEVVAKRAVAAESVGDPPPPPPPPPPPVIHVLARQIDPDTFGEFDRLAAEKDAARERLATLGAERENTPEATLARTEVTDMLGLDADASAREIASRSAALRATAPDDLLERFDTAQAKLDAALTTDTPEMIEARSALMDADFGMRDLAVPVSDAYRQARDIAPTLPVEVAEKEGATGTAEKKAEPEAERPEQAGIDAVEAPEPEGVAAQKIAPVAAGGKEGGTPEGQAETANVLAEAKPEGVLAAPGSVKGPLRTIKGTGETTERGLAASVEQSAIEEGLTEGFGDLPTYEKLNMRDQAKRVQDFMNKDYDRAKDIAMGRKLPPEGTTPEAFFVGIEQRAKAEGDVETLRQLATQSRLTSAATTMGQRLRTLGERDRAMSPVAALQDVQAAREKAFKGDLESAKANEVAQARAEVQNAASKLDAWQSFLKGIECS